MKENTVTIFPQQKKEKQRPRCTRSASGAAFILTNQLLASFLRLGPPLGAAVASIVPSIHPRDYIVGESLLYL